MYSTDLTKHTNRHSIEIAINRENIRLIYLGKSEVPLEVQSLLLQINPAAQFYTDVQLCMGFLQTVIDEQILFIISDMLSLDNLECIHSLQSIIAIFIYDDKQEINELRTKYPKIIDRYTNQNELLKSLQEQIQFIEKQTFVYSLFNQKPTRDLTKESASFLWHQILLSVLEQIPPNDSVRDEMLDKCSDYYQSNRNELDKIELFRRTYTRQQAIQWYTNEGFLYKLFNRALRTKDIELLYLFRFFIFDLCFEIGKEYEKMHNQGYLIVYRGQIMAKEEIEKLKEHIGCLISTNGFLSTSRDRNISLSFLKTHFSIHENVLFEIHIDLSIETIIVADISSYSSTPWEKEILFNINSLFKIESIEYDSINNFWQIKMFASPDGTNRVNEYLNGIQKEMDYDSPMIYFSHLLWNELGQINQAKNYLQILLKSLPMNHIDIPRVYIEFGNVYDEMGEYNIALNNYKLALDMNQKQIPEDSIRIASSLNKIGTVYKHMGNLDRAIDSYQQSLSIQEMTYPDDHLNKANTIRNLAIIYRDKQDWQNALNCFNRTLEMRQRLFPNTNHLDTAVCYGDIGNIYEKLNDLDLALNNYQQEFDIEEQCLPSNHPNLILHFDWIINTLKKNDQTEKAIELCEEKLGVLKSFINNQNHLRIARISILIATMYEDNNPKEADQHYQKALLILEDNQNDDVFQICLSTMTNFYWKCRMFDRALICQMKLLNLRRTVLSTNHKDIAYALRSLARLYKAMNKSNEALQYFNQSLNILQANYEAEHEDIKNIQMEIIDVKNIMKTLSASAKEDYEERYSSNSHKQLLISSQNDVKSRSFISNCDARNKPLISVSKSSTCVLF